MKLMQKVTRITAAITLAVIAIALVEVIGNLTAHSSVNGKHALVLEKIRTIDQQPQT